VPNWQREHLFDQMMTTLLGNLCLMHPTGKVCSMVQQETSKWRPLPLTTVELQKSGVKFLRMTSHQIMQVTPYISY
jgi:DNA topoisomerase-3